MVMIFPAKIFQIPFLPSKWRQIGWAITEFRTYMLTQIAEERNLIAEGKPGSGTLVSNLVRASNVQSQATEWPANQDATDAKKGDNLKPLTVDEILGNIFVFNFAGHDTTAISLAYSMLLPVAHPDVQDWIAEELQYYLDSRDSKTWKYEVVFPKLKRCLAVLVRRQC
jgi:cytochrome P450